uniref:Radial spoke head protein 9 homolog n=1 Tax=Hucho hucho TaxID=62062 RepID=A0A4W5KJ94_9TELE
TYLQILGIQGDYFIAQGVSDDEMSHKKDFNCVDWHLLPPATLSMNTQRQMEGGEAMEEDVMVRRSIKVNEEKGLPTTVHTIVKEVSVVPRSASIKSPHGLVQTNGSFEGLSSSETGKLKGFLHFTEPQNLKKKSILEMADLDPSINFVDPLMCVCVGLWKPMTPQHGYIYMGNGLKEPGPALHAL